MTRPAPSARVGLPCARQQRFNTRPNAEAYAAHTDRSRDVQFCRFCLGYHVRRPSDAEIAAGEERREAERKARVAAYLATVPERSRP